MNSIKRFALAFGMSAIVGGSLLLTALPGVVLAKPITSNSSPSDCSQNFLTFPTWFRGMVTVQPKAAYANEYECVVESPDQAGGLGTFITHIALNVIEIGLQIGGYLAAGFILYGGFMFLTSQGEPEAIKKARQTILNAVIGLVISIAAIGAVNLISAIIIHNP